LRRFFLISFVMMMLVFVGACGAAQEEGAGEEAAPGDEPAGEAGGGEASGAYPVTVTDSVGREVEISEEPGRIASMAPSITETLFAVGAGDRVVGVTTADDYPEEVQEIEKIGDFQGPNVEKLAEMEVDLLFLSFDYSTAEQAEDLEQKTGADVVVLNPQTVDEALAGIGTVGEITGETERAQTVEERLRGELAEIERAVEGGERPTVFYEIFDEPLQTAGGGSFIGDAITRAGGQNVAEGSDQDYPQYSVEQLLSQDPEFYFLGSSAGTTVEEVESRPNYENLRAVREGNVVLIDDALVSRPGPRIVEGIRQMAEVLHPDAFE
jgi:iron complex transport system substrate-binding protein